MLVCTLLTFQRMTGIDSFCNYNENTLKISKDVSRNLLNVATTETFFMF